MIKSKDIAEQLDLLIRLIAAGLLVGKSLQEQINLLNNVGIPPKIIAELTGTSANTVSVLLNRMKKKSKRK